MSEEVLAARQIRADKGVSGGSGQAPGADLERELPDPDDVAPMVVWLCTDAAANINGATFGVAGGRVSLHTDPVPVKSIFKAGRWTLDELLAIMPTTLAAGLVNPAPPTPPPTQK